jgi:hypothetical protein
VHGGARQAKVKSITLKRLTDKAMSATRLASKVHGWLALILVVPVLFWFVSGLFFAVAPIETVRSEHRIAKQPPAPVAMKTAALGLARISRSVAAAEKVEVRMLLGRPVAAVTAAHQNQARSPASRLQPPPPRPRRGGSGGVAEAALIFDADIGRELGLIS